MRHIISNCRSDKFIKIEVCCGSAEDVLLAARAGAHRAELNSALELGGLTPSIGTLSLARESGIEIITMLRPRGGGFCYSDKEFDTMLLDLKLLLEHGADGIAFGILTSDGQLDAKRCKVLIDVMNKHSKNKEAVFHMAFDEAKTEEFEMLTALEDLGFARLLTRGRAGSAHEGMGALKRYINFIADKGGKLEILPGGGIRYHNAPEIIKTTGATQVHGKYHKDTGGVLRVDTEGLEAYVQWAKGYFTAGPLEIKKQFP